MNPAELFALLGRAWARLLVYPGGLGMLLALGIYWKQSGWPVSGRASLRDLSLVAAPWLGLALLPLPGAGDLGRSIDFFTLMLLLEWPRLVVARQAAQAGDMQRLATLLNSYLVLGAALLLLTLSQHSFELGSLLRPPEEAPLWKLVAFWSGMLVLGASLWPLLGLGRSTSPAPQQPLARLGLLLRGVGWVGLVVCGVSGV